MRRSLVLGSLSVAAGLWAVGWIGVLGGAGWAENVENLGEAAMAAAAGIAGLAVAADPRQRGVRRPFFFLGLGAFAWAAGQSVWTFYALQGIETPFPSLADVGFLAALPLFGAGVLLWPRRKRLWTGSVVFDAVLAAGLAALLSYNFSLAPILQEGLHGKAGWIGLGYPLGDLFLATIVVGGVLLDGWAERGRLTIVGAGLLCLAVADTIFALDVGDGALSAAFYPTWILPFGIIAAAALLPREWPSSNRRVPALAVPLVATVLAGFVAAVQGIKELGDQAWAGVDEFGIAALLVLVSARSLHGARASARHASELEETERQLRRAQASRDRLLVELMNAQEVEARKVADLLHDDVVQQLTALGFRLELESQRHDLPRLTEIAGDASSITASIRRLLVGLHPAILDSQGLGPAVDVVAEELRERGVDVRVSAFPHRLPRELETLIYRLVQEGLANVQRHSGALYAEVELRIADGVLRGRITDNGSGATLDDTSSDGLVLRVARERVELAGGRFLVQARPGHGTDVVFELPLPQSGESAEAVS